MIALLEIIYCVYYMKIIQYIHKYSKMTKLSNLSLGIEISNTMFGKEESERRERGEKESGVFVLFGLKEREMKEKRENCVLLSPYVWLG